MVSILECPRMSASFTTPPSPWRKGGLSSPPRSGCLLSPFPLLVRKISPEAIYLAYFTSFRYSFPGRRMVRGFLLSDISVLISRINYIDMHFSSYKKHVTYTHTDTSYIETHKHIKYTYSISLVFLKKKSYT